MISIVMTSYNRANLLKKTLPTITAQHTEEQVEVVVVEDGDDGGLTRDVCRSYPDLVRYVQRKRRPELVYANPAPVINIGLRAARGDYIIVQNAECMHMDLDVIEQLISPLRKDPRVVTFANVAALDPNGNFQQWYTHLSFSPRPFFFCGAATRECFYKLRGMEESFVGYGYDDDYFGWLLTMNGFKYMFTDALVNHQWHTQTGAPGLDSNRAHFDVLIKEIMEGAPPISNRNRLDWGQNG
jgi:glycosyltransferase involved in cell wall biosynthesis